MNPTDDEATRESRAEPSLYDIPLLTKFNVLITIVVIDHLNSVIDS